MRNFMNLLHARWAQGKFLCVGLDSELSAVRSLLDNKGTTYDVLVDFNRQVVDATAEFVCAFKPNRAFYARAGTEGSRALTSTIEYINQRYPEIAVILDAKVADIGNTNNGYVSEAFDVYSADAVTVHPYLGGESLQPFLEKIDKGIIVLCRTSNPGAGELQDRSIVLTTAELIAFERWIGREVPKGTVPFYQHVAYQVAKSWNRGGNCAVVVGATYPEQLAEVRLVVGNMPILIPGIGAQGGDVQAAVQAGRNDNDSGMIINASRSVIFASKERDQFAAAAQDEAKRLHDLINQFRKA